METLLKGNLTRKEHLAKATKIATSQLKEGDELYIAIRTVKTESIEINKVTIAQQMAEKAYDAGKVNMEEMVPMVFKRHWKVFSEQEAHQLPLHRKWDHKIELKPDAPDVINSKVYPLSKDEQQVLDEYITDNLDKGYITASASPYGSPTFMVKKKDGMLRIVHDYRKLNKYTVMDVTPLPHIQLILEELRGKTLFSKFDIRAGYNNIWITEGDKYKTRFKTNKGLFEWVVMPFRLCNAPGMFTHMGNDVLRPLYAKYPGKFCHYMDDCIVMTRIGKWELHVKICHNFFELLEQHNLFLKPAKCKFFQTAIDYLGIRVEGGELMIDPAKITGIKE
jgi:Reverse transcriptase (RNA-dependent DNA polymerase)